MAAKYDALRRFLEEAADDEPVSLSWDELDSLVGGLPPSSKRREWWANTGGHSQAHAWARAGRRLTEVHLGEGVTFSPVGRPVSGAPSRGRTPVGLPPVLDGVAALDETLRRAGYDTTADAVAAHTLFLHPDTVAQTDGQPLFPVIRDMHRRGTFERLDDGTEVLLDDNTTPTRAFLWAAQRSRGADVQYNHVWGDPRNRATYTALWNICLTPAFLAKTTDGSNHPEVLAALRYRSIELYGRWPEGEERPARPAGYQRLVWPEPPPPVGDLEQVLRARLSAAPKSRPAQVARRVGWLFSDWHPDADLPGPDSKG